jgi:hypothetical protein
VAAAFGVTALGGAMRRGAQRVQRVRFARAGRGL